MLALVPSTISGLDVSSSLKRVAADKAKHQTERCEQPEEHQGQHDLRDCPADWEGQDHPANVNETNRLWPSQTQGTDDQGKRRQG